MSKQKKKEGKNVMSKELLETCACNALKRLYKTEKGKELMAYIVRYGEERDVSAEMDELARMDSFLDRAYRRPK